MRGNIRTTVERNSSLWSTFHTQINVIILRRNKSKAEQRYGITVTNSTPVCSSTPSKGEIAVLEIKVAQLDIVHRAVYLNMPTRGLGFVCVAPFADLIVRD